MRRLIPVAALVTVAAFLGVLALRPAAVFGPAVPLVMAAEAPGVGAPGGGVPENPFPNRSPAPSFEGGLGWLNTGGPIELRDLRGKVVLVDFWTYCCINCMHVLPDLKSLEEKYPDELVVVGVHSAKFDNEKDTDAIRQAVQRYDIAHPVLNDANMAVWRKYGARAWPTVVLIDPEGNYCGYLSGEGNRETLDAAIGRLIAYHAAKGTLDRTPVRFDLEKADAAPTPLRYPGKVLPDDNAARGAAGGRLFVSDSNHNRIVIAGTDGTLLDVIGSGQPARTDGGYAGAAFLRPQGMALAGDTLYVADTENHLIRAVDLKAKRVSTLAGTGEQAAFRAGGGPPRTTALNSPWDLLVHDGVLYVAMAGSHQIWSHVLGSDRIEPFAGSGREDVIDGPHLQAALAQPSGMATDGQALYVCDSEGSAIRRVPFDRGRPVTTPIGPHDLPGGGTLFEFGDVDAAGSAARLQHPLGIAYRRDAQGGLLYVADSYNHKIKYARLNDRGEGGVATLIGDGEAGDAIDPPRLSEPAGVAVVGKTLIVADTNNHRLLRVDPARRTASVFPIAGLTPPATATESAAPPEPPADAVRVAAAQTVGPDAPATVTIRPVLPAGYKLNREFPAATTVRPAEEAGAALLAGKPGARLRATAGADGALTFALPLSGTPGKAEVRIALTYGYCRDGEGGLCKLGTVEYRLPLTVQPGAGAAVTLP